MLGRKFGKKYTNYGMEEGSASYVTYKYGNRFLGAFPCFRNKVRTSLGLPFCRGSVRINDARVGTLAGSLGSVSRGKLRSGLCFCGFTAIMLQNAIIHCNWPRCRHSLPTTDKTHRLNMYVVGDMFLSDDTLPLINIFYRRHSTPFNVFYFSCFTQDKECVRE